MYILYQVHGRHKKIIGRYKTLKDARHAVSKYSTGSMSVLDGSAKFWAFFVKEDKRLREAAEILKNQRLSLFERRNLNESEV